MKKIIFSLFLILMINFSAFSQVGIGFYGGLSTPNNKINDVYNKSKFKLNEDSIYNFFRGGVKSGYTLGVKARLPLMSKLSFNGGISWNKFPESEIRLTDPDTKEEIAVLRTSQNVVPICAGLNFYVLDAGLFDVYLTGELAYNYVSNTVDIEAKKQVIIPLSTNPTYSRIGAGIGAGFDVNVFLGSINIEGRYNFLNLINKDSEEQSKNYFTLTLGIYFGSIKPSN